MNERWTRLAESPIWDMQRRYFERRGPRAWADGEVPMHVTNNPVLAGACAETAFGLLRDWARLGGDTTQPVYILELGAGSGRFAYYMLRELSFLYASATELLPPFCYIVSDMSLENVEFCRAHERLLPFVEKGVLDFARFDAGRDSVIHLMHADVTLGEGSLTQPLVAVAHYFFDSVPHNLYYFEQGKAFECLVDTQQADAPHGARPHAAADVNELTLARLTYGYREISPPYTGDRHLNELLQLYRQRLSRSHVSLPTGGLETLETIRGWSRAGVLVLSADKGHVHMHELDNHDVPSPVHHGSLSYSVNYHALAHYCEWNGGIVCSSSRPQAYLTYIAMLVARDAHAYKETKRAYGRSAERFSPSDYHVIKQAVARQAQALDLGELAAFIGLSGCDPRLFQQCLPRIEELAEGLTPAEQAELTELALRVWDNYYALGEPGELAFRIGTLLYRLEQFEAAIRCYRHTLEHDGEDASVYYNIGLCFYRMVQDDECLHYMAHSLRLEPGKEDALHIVRQVEGEVSSNGH